MDAAGMNKLPSPHRAGLGQALVASLLVGALYASGGWARAFAGLILLAILLSPGPGGKSVLAGLLDIVSRTLEGGLA
jgi:hypothetical protein